MPTYIVYYSQGNSNGPFSIYLSGSSGLNLYASPVTRAELELGYTVTFPDGIPSSSVDVFDIAYGCFTDQNVPFPSPSPSVTPTISITPSRTPTISVSPTVTPSITKTPSVTPSVTPAPTITPTQTPSATPSLSPDASPSPTPTLSPTPSITRTPSLSPPVEYTSTQTGVGAGYPYGACLNLGTSQNLYCTRYPNGNIIRVFQLIAGVYTPWNGQDLFYAFYFLSSGYPFPSLPYQINTNGYASSPYTSVSCM